MSDSKEQPNWDIQYIALEIRHAIREGMMSAHQLGIEGKDLAVDEIDYVVNFVWRSIGIEEVKP